LESASHPRGHHAGRPGAPTWSRGLTPQRLCGQPGRCAGRLQPGGAPRAVGASLRGLGRPSALSNSPSRCGTRTRATAHAPHPI